MTGILGKMRSKRFRFKKRQVQTRLNGFLALVLLGIAFILYLSLDLVLPLQVMAVASLLLLLLGNNSDKAKSGYLYVQDMELVIKNQRSRRRIGLNRIKDVSIVDPSAAKNYIAGRIIDSDNTLSSTKRTFIYTQFNTVELGLQGGLFGRLLALVQGTIQSKTNDLVLLRMMDGTDLLLSPAHANDVVSYLYKMLKSANEEQAEQQTSLFQKKNTTNA